MARLSPHCALLLSSLSVATFLLCLQASYVPVIDATGKVASRLCDYLFTFTFDPLPFFDFERLLRILDISIPTWRLSHLAISFDIVSRSGSGISRIPWIPSYGFNLVSRFFS